MFHPGGSLRCNGRKFYQESFRSISVIRWNDELIKENLKQKKDDQEGSFQQNVLLKKKLLSHILELFRFVLGHGVDQADIS